MGLGFVSRSAFVALVCACALPTGCGSDSCTESSACEQPPVGLVEIPPADDIPAPAASAEVNCGQSSAGDVPFCSAVERYLGRTYDPSTQVFGASVAGLGTVQVAPVVSNCTTTCSKKSVLGIKLSANIKYCSLNVGAQASTAVTTADGTELDEHVALDLPNASQSPQWDLTQEIASLETYCGSKTTAEVALELWTGKIEVQDTAQGQDTAGVKLCCGDDVVCLDGSLGASASGESTWHFQGTVGVKLASHDDFCGAARVWLDAHCKSSGTPLPAACSNPWWDG